MNISRKQLAALFICSLVTWTVGNGLLPLLPLYAVNLGADATLAGLYLAFSYIAIALGALTTGWVSGSRYGIKPPFIVSGLLAVPLAWILGQVNSVWALSVVTALLWFCGGLGLALISILAGLSAGGGERGKIFGLLALTSGLGAVIGGLGAGWLVENWGYAALFSVLAVFMLLSPLTAVFLEEKRVIKSQPEANLPRETRPLGRNYFLLFSASILASIAGFVILLIRSLGMSAIGFGPMEITSTVVIGGLFSMPLPFLMGWLSDRIDRKIFLILGYLCAVAALLLLVVSSALWHFWLALILQGIAVGCNSSIGNAWVTDLVPRESLGKGLALFGSTAWIGGIVGFALAGYLLQNLGFTPTCVIGVCLGLAAVGLLIPIRARPGAIRQPDASSA